MSVALLQNPATLWDVYVGGPYYPTTMLFSNIALGKQGIAGPWETALITGADHRPLWVFSQSGTGVTQVQDYHNGILCLQTRTTNVRAQDSLEGIRMMPITDITGLDDTFRNPSWRRVAWFSVNLAMDVGTLDAASGLMFQKIGTQQTVTAWPVAPATDWFGGFGIQGDGAGGWNWVSVEAGVGTAPTETVALSGISDASEWHTFDFVTVSGAGSRPAELLLFVDDVLTLTRNWVDAPVITPLSPGPPYCFYPILSVGTTTDENIYFGDWEFKMGRFLPDGRELFK